eukprot:SAG11_NODE_2685_length_3101_cov_1.843771_3_plen_62_part_00
MNAKSAYVEPSGSTAMGEGWLVELVYAASCFPSCVVQPGKQQQRPRLARPSHSSEGRLHKR